MARVPLKHRSVESVEKFVGWSSLEGLVDKSLKTQGIMQAALIAILFTGGFRVSEVVHNRQIDHGGLKPENIIDAGKTLRFSEVEVMKKYKKVPGSGVVCHDTGPHKGHAMWDAEHKHYTAKRKTDSKEIKRTFSVPSFEPFVKLILEYKRMVPKGEYLFDFSRQKAWRMVQELDKSIWPHWFRSQRARQLADNLENGGYEWNKEKLKLWFKWESEATAEIYAKQTDALILESSFPGELIRN